jgi:methylenetetrahydrofolate reductase (NADPH)
MPDQPITELLRQPGQPTLSFEFFPPKDEAGLDNLRRVAEQLLPTRPDFATCTYGAGGSTRHRTLQVCDLLRELGYGPVMPHLTCVGASRGELVGIVDSLYAAGYRNIMTLRGDPPKGDTTFQRAADGLSHASELVALIKARQPDVACGVAAYPEVHPEAPDEETDLRWLKHKLDAGGDFGTTQLFFDNQAYFRFVARCCAAGVTKPILPGLLPAISLKQVQRMCSMCRTALPPALAQRMEAAGGEGEAAERVGIQWAEQQMEELVARGVPGIHLYILNRSRAVLTGELARFFSRQGR